VFAKEALFFKIAQDATEIAGIDLEFVDECAGGGLLLLRQFIKNPCLNEGEAGFQKPLGEKSDLLGIKPVEPAK
jgi:hypothetical protein